MYSIWCAQYTHRKDGQINGECATLVQCARPLIQCGHTGQWAAFQQACA